MRILCCFVVFLAAMRTNAPVNALAGIKAVGQHVGDYWRIPPEHSRDANRELPVTIGVFQFSAFF